MMSILTDAPLDKDSKPISDYIVGRGEVSFETATAKVRSQVGLAAFIPRTVSDRTQLEQ